MFTKFQKQVLEELLKKYENSKLSKVGLKVKKDIKLDTEAKCLKTYSGLDSYKYRDNNDIDLKELEKMDFIKTNYQYDSFKSLSLNVLNVDKIYDALGKENPQKEIIKIKEVLENYDFNNYLADFKNFILVMLENKGEYPKSYFKDSMELDLILKSCDALIKLDKETFKRDFSVNVLGDSKTFEKIENKVCKVIKEYNKFEDLSELSNEEVLESYNLVKNSTYLLVKNNLNFKINEQVINLNSLGFEMSLSDEMIKNIEFLACDFDEVITVENLTSFYALKKASAVIIYLSGFHNHTKQMFLTKLYEKFPNKAYYHFGDIDAGGFYIFNNLKKKTLIPFKPYKMSINELELNKDNLKALTENDISRLEKMLVDNDFKEFYEVINYMLLNNIKLEQEILD